MRKSLRTGLPARGPFSTERGCFSVILCQLPPSACVFCAMGKKGEAMAALKKSVAVGWKDVVWTRRDPDLSILHGGPEFDRLFPPTEGVA